MAAKRDYYEVLGIARTAPADAIKKAYRKLAMKYHPDRNKGDKAAEDKFKEVSEAYEVLSDTDKKAQYDRYGHDGLKAAFGPGGFDFARDFTHFSDLEDVLGSFFGDGGGVFSSLFGGGGDRRQRTTRTGPQRGADLRFDLEIDFEEAAYGSHRDITLPMTTDCEGCHGTGMKPGTQRSTCQHCGGHGMTTSGGGFFQVRQACPVCGGTGTMATHPCRECDGSGRVRIQNRITLKIPRGVETGSRLRLSGKGESGTRGGPAGDLYVILHVKSHSFFERHDDDLACEVPVPFDTATLGGTIQVPTLEGLARLKVAAGTETGRVLRLSGKGMPRVNESGRGDLHVHILVEIPTRLSSTQKKRLKELGESLGDANYPALKRLIKLADDLYERRSQLKEDT